MNRREKALAALVGILVLLAVLNFAIKRIVSQFSDRRDQIAQLQTDIAVERDTRASRYRGGQRAEGLQRTIAAERSRHGEFTLPGVAPRMGRESEHQGGQCQVR